MISCLAYGLFTMTAEVLRQDEDLTDDGLPGEYIKDQNKITGQIKRVWKPFAADDTDTPNIETQSFPCYATSAGFGLNAGGVESFSTDYTNMNYVNIQYPTEYILSKRDRVTNIRDREGNLIWIETDVKPGVGEPYKATVFNVVGIRPVPSPLGFSSMNIALLERAEVD